MNNMEIVTAQKVKHIKTGVIETIVGMCKVKVNGAWTEGVIYKGNDRYTNKEMLFVRTLDEFNKEFEKI